MSDYKYDFVASDVESGKVEYIDPDALKDRLENVKANELRNPETHTKLGVLLMVVLAVVLIAIIISGLYIT